LIRLSRTYEELKQASKFFRIVLFPTFIAYLWGIETISFISSIIGIKSLSRTYEELKPFSSTYGLPTDYRLSRTYEELKLCFSAKNQFFAFVYRVPMRNWNSILLRKTIVSGLVYRVPMRNWNLSCIIVPSF